MNFTNPLNFHKTAKVEERFPQKKERRAEERIVQIANQNIGGGYPLSPRGQSSFLSSSQKKYTHERLQTDLEVLIKSLAGKRRPQFKEPNVACQKINQCQSFKEALLQLQAERFSPNACIYLALLEKAESWHCINFLFKNIPIKERNELIYIKYVDACRKNEQFSEVKEIFNKTRDSGIANNIVIYNSYIDACGRTHEFLEAQRVFIKARDLGIATEYTYTCYINACGKNHEPQEAHEIFHEAVELFSNVIIYNSYINACGRNHRFEEAETIFRNIVRLGIANEYTYTGYINACGENHKLRSAQRAFNQAIGLGMKNIYIYNSYIDACGKNYQFAEAQKIFDKARNLGIADVITYNSYIDACRKNLELREAHEIFIEAVESGLANQRTYHVYIDLLVQHKNYDEANLIFTAGKIPVVKKMINEKKAIDLHKFSYGSGFLALLRALKMLPQGESELVVITGKGCEKDGSYLSFRTALKEKIEKELNLQCLIDPNNEGILLVQLASTVIPMDYNHLFLSN